MRKLIATILVSSLLVLADFSHAQSGGGGQPSPLIQLPAGLESPADSRLARISELILREEPAYPPQFVVPAAQRSLDEMGLHRTPALEALLDGNVSATGARSFLLRHMAAALTGAQQATLREKLAAARILAVLNDTEPGRAVVDSSDLLGKLKTTSQVQHRRLLEGRVEDDELYSSLKKARGDAPAVARKVEPKVLSAADIISEYSRKNVVGSALDRLQAYSIEAKIPAPGGEVRNILLVRLRPDRFRLAIRSGGVTQQIVASGSRGYWTHTPGQPPKLVAPEALGDLARLGEFLNPLLRQEGCEFTRLEDGQFDGRPVYRICVVRADGSRYDSCIDRETLRESGREHPGGSVTRFSDFREVAGVSFAFREETTDAEGKKTSVEVTRVRANHGIVPALFDPPESNDYFNIERLMAASTTAGKGNP